MKKILSFITLILICSCSTSSDNNGNSNTTVVPLPPTGLTANVVSPTQINLSWTDNSTNETGFKIERRTGTAIYAVVGTVNQDVLTFPDSGLTPSTTYSYRVYAYNAVGNSLTYTNEVTLTTTTYPAGSVFCASGPTAIVDVTNPATGKIWMDRNLGATQAATSSTDANSYGDLYQWGRRSDGHQCRTSPTTTTLSSTDQPANGSFIVAPNSPFDWRSPQNTSLWQGVNGVNNPCPSGYRLPTETEINAERASWSSNTSAGAFASPLKLPMAGFRNGSNGSLTNVGTVGSYWSSTVSSTTSQNLNFYSSSANMNTLNRALGLSVRCLKD